MTVALAIFTIVVGCGSLVTLCVTYERGFEHWFRSHNEDEVHQRIASNADQVLQEVRKIPDVVWQDTARRQAMILDILNKHNLRDRAVMQHLIEELSTDDVDQQFSQMLLEHEAYTQREITS